MSSTEKIFKKVLIANRGEIAVRIAKTLQEMGIKAVAVYSEFDKNSLHVSACDEAYVLSGTTLSETYLNIEKIIDIAKSSDVDAIHPGYGFLSENPKFAKACQEANITFVGPSSEVIASMGDKILAKKTMEQANVPIIPGWHGDVSNLDEFSSFAKKIGYPVLIKAVAGGGGKGMRLVHDSSGLEQALSSASREAQKAFGDKRIFLEKYIVNPRHIEFQIFGDNHGNVIHLFERECSIQRRHQKIIEESPSVAITDELRDKMGKAAVKAAKAIGYTNAGTVEFIVDENKNFYFLEVNTRLQVEHPVTESVIHGDLVRAQIMVAMGKPLLLTQKDLIQDGHSIECRIYAEDPLNNFLPSTGKLHVYKEPSGLGIRIDSGVKEGDQVSVHYDPLLSKLIVWAKTREAAIDKILWALSHYVIIGVTTNISYLYDLISTKEFLKGEINTHFIEKVFVKPNNDFQGLGLAISAVLFHKHEEQLLTITAPGANGMRSDPWLVGGDWRVI